MSAPKWSDLLVSVEREFPSCSKPGATLTAEQVEQLQAVENAAENFTICVLHGVAAIGELMVHASAHGELTEDLARSSGWLISALALLSMNIGEEAAAANYKLQNLPHKGVAK
ncbi:hypothetical protein [Pseudomonas syringae]|uniref:hypothetical protein n=1 Tax=Pseudomonas syringae TaxID=317 RepID=UPI00068DBF5D|nr:hypothetical protein [Pseudomonas syringae]